MSSQGHAVTIHCSQTSQSIAWRRHQPPVGGIPRAHPHLGSSLAPNSEPPAMLVSTPCPPTFVLSVALVFPSRPGSLAVPSQGPVPVTLATPCVFKHIQQEGPFDHSSGLPLRLHHTVPPVLPMPQHCWPALWAPVLPPTLGGSQPSACSRGLSPVCLYSLGRAGLMVPSAQHPSGLAQALRPL